MRLVFLGPPSSGKGTYASKLAPKIKLLHISSGQTMREARDHPAFGKIIEEYQQAGKPVPDEVSVKMIMHRLKESDCKNGFIFDCPYNKYQAEQLDTDPNTKIDVAILVNTPIHIIKNRVLGRRICEKCGANYNVRTNLLPKVSGVCDKCGSKLIQRDDDKEAAFAVRMSEYNKRAQPLAEYYKNTSRLLTLEWNQNEIGEGDVDVPPDTMVRRIIALLKKNKHL